VRVARRVEPEWLDELPADDPDAVRSRHDLRRVNGWMRNATLVARMLAQGRPPANLVELGAGDGTFLLGVARRLGPSWTGTRARLVDRVMLVSEATRRAFADLGWELEVVAADVFVGLARSPARDATVLANLFLHHLPDEPLRELLARVAERSGRFIACEPRRSWFALAASRCVGLISGNAVTRHDAVVSVRAGFAGRELTELWPAGEGWILEEHGAGPFSHVFCGRRGAGVSSRAPGTRARR
jgi:hypothetical protein